MRKILTALLFIIQTAAWSQSSDNQQHEDYIKLVWDQNIPEALRNFYNQDKIRSVYEINKSLNPFYLRGDFNSDKKPDYALAIIEIKTGKKGFLIFHPSDKKYYLIGAGVKIPTGFGDNYSYIDAWEVSDNKKVGQGIGEEAPPKLIGEAILIQKLESSSALIYWNGKEYKQYHQGD